MGEETGKEAKPSPASAQGRCPRRRDQGGRQEWAPGTLAASPAPRQRKDCAGTSLVTRPTAPSFGLSLPPTSTDPWRSPQREPAAPGFTSSSAAGAGLAAPGSPETGSHKNKPLPGRRLDHRGSAVSPRSAPWAPVAAWKSPGADGKGGVYPMFTATANLSKVSKHLFRLPSPQSARCLGQRRGCPLPARFNWQTVTNRDPSRGEMVSASPAAASTCTGDGESADTAVCAAHQAVAR